MRPSEVSRHVSPPTACQASGPEWRCEGAVIPGVKSASINRAEYFSPATTGSGPISAMRFPCRNLHFSSSMVINHTLPNDSTTVPAAPCLLAPRHVLDTHRDARIFVVWRFDLRDCRPGSSFQCLVFAHSAACTGRPEQQHLALPVACIGAVGNKK